MPDQSPLDVVKDPQLRAMLKRLGERLAASPRAAPEPEQEAPAPDSPYRVDRWPNSRFYAAYRGDKLLAVTVYKKGAEEVTKQLEARDRAIAALRAQLDQRPVP